MGAMTACGGEGRIEGVVLAPLKEIPTEGGVVLHMLRADSPLFAGFGEIYFSEVQPGVVRAWKKHTRQTQHFAAPVGRIRVALYDGRSDSPSFGAVCAQVLGRPDAYGLLRIPPGIWYGFAAEGNERALIANCTDMPHVPEETERLPRDTDRIPYAW
jgi:dTDP-4-dehydrorhamnose 3,5-epimerase